MVEPSSPALSHGGSLRSGIAQSALLSLGRYGVSAAESLGAVSVVVTVQAPHASIVLHVLRAKYRQKRNGHTARGQASGLCATERREAGTASAWPTRWAQIHHRRRISIRALDRCTLRSIVSAKRVSIEGAA
jgi:hypothetical protein